MKILTREEFYKSPIGTLFVKVDSQHNGEFMQLETDIMFFGGTIGENDFGYNDLLEISTEENIGRKGHLCNEVSDIISEAAKNKGSFKLDFNCGGRDGLFDDEQLFAVFEEADIDQLLEHILEFSSKKEQVFMGLKEAEEIWSNRSNGSVQRCSVVTGVNPHTRVPVWNSGKGGRLWFDGELAMDELEALLVIGRHQLGNPVAEIDEVATEEVIAVYEANGLLVELVSPEHGGNFIRINNNGKPEDIIKDFGHPKEARDCFMSVVHSHTRGVERMEVLQSYTANSETLSLKKHEDGEHIVVEQINGVDKILYRDYSDTNAGIVFDRFLLKRVGQAN